MTKRTFKRLAALLVSSTMIIGSCFTVFAEGETTAAADGAGTYEGGEMQYPTLSVTLPTITSGAYNYIADPNGLIAATSGAAHTGKTFTGTTGIFFPTTASTYTADSEAFTVKNQNAQDIDVTIKMEQKTAGAESIAYSDTATFGSDDKAKKLYLAVTDGAESDPQVSALTSAAAATLTTTVAGKTDNYEAGWTSQGGYKYQLKTGDLTWNECSYNLTGALNTNATWEDSLTFPTITVTWSFAEHSDAPAAPTTPTVSADSVVVGGFVNVTLPTGVSITGIQKRKTDGTFNELPAEYYTLEDITGGKKLTIASNMRAQYQSATQIKIVFSEGDPITIGVTTE